MNDTLTRLRHSLHRAAELSDHEQETSSILREELRSHAPDAVHSAIGGHGIAAVYEAIEAGPTVLVRADMDALPLDDDPALAYTSSTPHTAHLCGHDGHMAILVGVAAHLAAQRPTRGRVVLLFQPAEETGAGAQRVLEDPAFAELRPHAVIAQHNLPGYPLGAVVLRKGVFASASCGMIVEFRGRSAHASEPHLGLSPIAAMTQLATALMALPQQVTGLHEAAKMTIVGMEAGGPAFGTSTGSGRVMATLRAHEDAVMQRLMRNAETLATHLARAHGLKHHLSWTEEFPSTTNDDAMVDLLASVATERGCPVLWHDTPFAWSEDFGHFTAQMPGVLFGLGAGVDQPALHADGYDFPDALIEPGSALLADLARRFLREREASG